MRSLTSCLASCCRITLSNIPLLRGKRSRFAMVGNQQDDEDLGVVARRAGLYPSELPDPFEGPDNDIDWEQAFAFGSIEEVSRRRQGGRHWGGAERCCMWSVVVPGGPQAGVEGVTEDEVATFGEEEVEEDEEFAMGSIEVFRSPAYKRERGLLTEEEEAAFFPDTDAMDAYKAGEADESYFLDEDDEDDPEPSSAFYQMYESQIPQLTEVSRQAGRREDRQQVGGSMHAYGVVADGVVGLMCGGSRRRRSRAPSARPRAPA